MRFLRSCVYLRPNRRILSYRPRSYSSVGPGAVAAGMNSQEFREAAHKAIDQSKYLLTPRTGSWVWEVRGYVSFDNLTF